MHNIKEIRKDLEFFKKKIADRNVSINFESLILLDKENSKNHTNIFFVDNENNQSNGWQGRLCWDVPVVCTYMKIQVNRNNNYLFINKLSKK